MSHPVEQVANRATDPFDSAQNELHPEAVSGQRSTLLSHHHPEPNREDVGKKEQLKQDKQVVWHAILRF